MAKSTTYCIYRIFCVVTSLSYVGLSRSPEKRQRTHFHQLKAGVHKNTRLQTAFNEHGEQTFRFEILERNIPGSSVGKRERYWIAKFTGHENGYNMTTGGEVNPPPSKPSSYDPDLKHPAKPIAQRGYIERDIESGLDDWTPYYRPDWSSDGLIGEEKRIAEKLKRLRKPK